jgi:DNA repair photolyase
MFDMLPVMAETPDFRWELRGQDRPQLQLFDDGPQLRIGKGAYRGLEFLEVEARRIVNDIPEGAGLPFRHTINAYRGCSHACSYCFARPTHEYLNLDSGKDFESKIVVKVNAVDLVRAETHPSRWGGELIAMGTNTDPYQPAEGKYRLTQGIVEVLGDRANPFSILTKSSLVLRDLDLLADVARRVAIHVDFSIGTLDDAVWRLTEPGTPHPRRRVEAMAKLNAAGVPSGALVAPVLPGLSDHPDQLREVVRACVDAGARSIHPLLLHLGRGVKEHYLRWLGVTKPELVPLHITSYRGRKRLPDAQRALSELVRGLVDEFGGTPS